MKLNFSFSIAIDLGTANTLAAVPGKGIIFDEPTVVARLKKRPGVKPKPIAFGGKAKKMIGREPQTIEVVAPLKNGVIADFDAAVAFLAYLLDIVTQLPSRWPRLLKPQAIIGVPSGATEVEKRAVRAAAEQAGLGRVYLVEELILAALGAGLAIEKAVGHLIFDLGAGVTEMGVISLGGLVLQRCLQLGGQRMDQAIIDFVRLKYGLLIGRIMAEKVKINLGSVLPTGEERKMRLPGRDLETGLPREVEISEAEIREAISPLIQEMITNLTELIEETPPELTLDIARRGIVLTGGGAQLRGMEPLIAETTKMPVWTAKQPREVVVRGGVKLWQNRDQLKSLAT